ncbi:MAG: protein kinase [bacterium]|nr:protein kinase [bacterium]
MPDSRLDKIREYLRDLRGQLVRGEIDLTTHFRMKEKMLSELTPRDRQALATPPELGVGPSGAHTSVPSLAELDLAPGRVLFDQWRLVRELGRGGFGVVFEAEELRLRETQAVKVLDPALTSRPELLSRLRREVWVMRSLDPRHIVRVYDYREDLDEHLVLISMEYVAGATVLELCDLARRKEQPVAVAVVVAILAETLEALAEAHDQGVIHRGVTPGNILLAGAGPEELLADPTREPGGKLVDFGIAGLVEPTELSQKTQALGTAPYVAPEALEPGGQVITPSADVYGAGAVAYELLTGKPPLGRFPLPSETRPDVPAELDRLLPELLDVDPAKRPPARRARERALSRRPLVPAPTGGTQPTSPAPPVARGKRRTWIAVTAVLAAIVLLVILLDNIMVRGRPPAAARRPSKVPDVPQVPSRDLRDKVAIFVFSPYVDGLDVTISGGIRNAVEPLVWDWGDGTITKSRFNARHTYKRAGEYTVKVTARGRKGVVTKEISIEAGRPVYHGEDRENLHRLSLFTPSIRGRTVTINGVVVAPVKRIQWDWGDGTIDAHHHFPTTHTYDHKGRFLIQVSTHDAKGRVSLKSLRIEVP